MPQSSFRVVLEQDFCLITFEIYKDKFTFHSNNYLTQTSGEINNINEIIEGTAQSSNEKVNDEEKFKTTGEGPNLDEPLTYNEAMQAPDANEWIDAMKFELNALDKICVWEVTQPPENTNIVGSKWIYHYKYNPASYIIKRQAHLVA
jgi:hypothetical protein